MKKLAVPFNIDLLVPDARNLSMMRPIKSLDSFLGATKNFNPDGLYSNEIFGMVGTAPRSTRYAYIDLKVSIIHPTIYKTLVGMKAFYKDILAGKEFARFDPMLKDFVKSDLVDGFTGYHFFCEHLPKIEIPTNDSISRQQAVSLFEKYKHRCMLSQVFVLPAGLRDLEMDEYNRATSDEVNELYFKLISISNTINPSSVKASIESYNPQRVSLQNTFNEIYEYFTKIIEGKKNLMMGKWASRKVFNGTRNVITAMTEVSKVLGAESNVNLNDTLVGLYQAIKGMLPITLYQLKTGFLDRCFTTPGAPALLCNSETLESHRVLLKPASYSQWLSSEGLEKALTYFKEETIRHDPIVIEGHYLGLTYRGPDGTFALINGVEQLPEGRLAEHCTPITYTELLYAAIYNVARKYSGFVTRYPITGIGSVYPSRVYLKTTVRSEARQELDPDSWESLGPTKIAYEFPILGSSFYNSLSPSSFRLVGLGADFDGDTCSFNIVYSDESIKECESFYNSKKAYVGTDGKFIIDSSVETIMYVLQNITGRLKYTEATA